MTRIATILAALALSLVFAGQAQAEGFDAVASNIANHQAQGWESNHAPMEVLEQRIANGGRIYVSCSIAAELAYRAAKRMGLPARRVSVITNGRFDGYSDGHAMVEVKVGGHWVLYDITLDRVAVDRSGHRVGLAFQMRAGHARRWRTISTDSHRWNWKGLDTTGRRILAPYAHSSVSRWYDHVMGTALIETSPGQYAYHGTGHSARIEAAYSGHYHWVGAAAWRSLSI